MRVIYIFFVGALALRQGSCGASEECTVEEEQTVSPLLISSSLANFTTNGVEGWKQCSDIYDRLISADASLEKGGHGALQKNQGLTCKYGCAKREPCVQSMSVAALPMQPWDNGCIGNAADAPNFKEAVAMSRTYSNCKTLAFCTEQKKLLFSTQDSSGEVQKGGYGCIAVCSKEFCSSHENLPPTDCDKFKGCMVSKQHKNYPPPCVECKTPQSICEHENCNSPDCECDCDDDRNPYDGDHYAFANLRCVCDPQSRHYC